MKRRVLNLLTSLSLLLCAAGVALWVRGRGCHDNLTFDFRGKTYQFSSGGGRFVAARAKGQVAAFFRVGGGMRWTKESPFRWDDLYDNPMFNFRGVFGLGYVTTQTAHGILVPHWLACLATAVLPALWVVRRARRTAPVGHCARCGYDLRATPERCPECGAAPRPPAPCGVHPRITPVTPIDGGGKGG
jgi:hypothetical protein